METFLALLEEIQAEAWHILTAIYTHQQLKGGLAKSATRYDLANQVVALNALGEMLIIRVARLADKRKDTRSVSMLVKRRCFSAPATQVEAAATRFLSLADPVVRIRHEQIAHMRPGVLSTHEPKDLPVEALRATEALVDLIDIASGRPLSYKYKVGSIEAVIDLRASLEVGSMVAG